MIFSLFGQFLVGWLLADLLSGIVHWLEDRVLRMDTPILGAAVVRPNRVHHTDQLKFTYSGFINRNLWLWIVVVAVSILLWFFVPITVWASMTLGGLVVNEVHRLAHRPALGGATMRMFQEMGLLQSTRHHGGHHQNPSQARYCILTNWLNPILDYLKVWNGCERFLDWIGLEPNRGTA